LGGCDQLRFSNAVRLGGCDELRFSGVVRLGGCDELRFSGTVRLIRLAGYDELKSSVFDVAASGAALFCWQYSQKAL
jgi:hypothetical protein